MLTLTTPSSICYLAVDPEVKDVASYATAAVGVAGAAALAVQAKKKRDSTAVIELYNNIVELADPCELTQQMVSDVGSKYGINMQRDDLDGLKKLYGQYLESLIPSGDTQLRCVHNPGGDQFVVMNIRAQYSGPGCCGSTWDIGTDGEPGLDTTGLSIARDMLMKHGKLSCMRSYKQHTSMMCILYGWVVQRVWGLRGTSALNISVCCIGTG